MLSVKYSNPYETVDLVKTYTRPYTTTPAPAPRRPRRVMWWLTGDTMSVTMSLGFISGRVAGESVQLFVRLKAVFLPINGVPQILNYAPTSGIDKLSAWATEWTTLKPGPTSLARMGDSTMFVYRQAAGPSACLPRIYDPGSRGETRQRRFPAPQQRVGGPVAFCLRASDCRSDGSPTDRDQPSSLCLSAAGFTPEQYLALCLAVGRGDMPIELIESDVLAWKREHGEITRESVDRWLLEA